MKPRKGRKRLSAEDLERRNMEICKLYEDGLLLKDIGDQIGLSPNMVGKVLKDRGYERPSKPEKRLYENDPVDREKVKALWGHGLSRTQIAERLGVSGHCITIILTSLGLTSVKSRRDRYDGIGGIGKPVRSRSNGALQRIAGRT